MSFHQPIFTRECERLHIEIKNESFWENYMTPTQLVKENKKIYEAMRRESVIPQDRLSYAEENGVSGQFLQRYLEKMCELPWRSLDRLEEQIVKAWDNMTFSDHRVGSHELAVEFNDPFLFPSFFTFLGWSNSGVARGSFFPKMNFRAVEGLLKKKNINERFIVECRYVQVLYCYTPTCTEPVFRREMDLGLEKVVALFRINIIDFSEVTADLIEEEIPIVDLTRELIDLTEDTNEPIILEEEEESCISEHPYGSDELTSLLENDFEQDDKFSHLMEELFPQDDSSERVHTSNWILNSTSSPIPSPPNRKRCSEKNNESPQKIKKYN